MGSSGRAAGGAGHETQSRRGRLFLLACNTVHTAVQYIENAVDLPFLHIVDPTAYQLIARGFSTVGLLGSRYTMAGDYFVGRLQNQYGLKVLVAEGEHQDNVHNALYQELAKGEFLPGTRDKFKAAIADLISRAAPKRSSWAAQSSAFSCSLRTVQSRWSTRRSRTLSQRSTGR